MARRPALLAGLFAALALGVTAVPATAAPATTTLTGVLEVRHEDHVDTGRSAHSYVLRGSDGASTVLEFDDRGPDGLGARKVEVTGTRERPGVMRVGSSSAVTSSEPAAAVAATTSKRVAVLLYDFLDSDHAARPVGPTFVDQVLFSGTESTNGFLADSSFSQLTMVGAVFDWVTIPSRSTDACAFDSWGSQARGLTPGFDDAAYDQVIHVMPKSTCSFGGVAYMPGKYSWTVLQTTDVGRWLRGITSHEYGHSLGIHHAGSYRCTSAGKPVTLGGNCTLAEYGDPFSVMGQAGDERQYTGYQKGRLGWLTSAGTTTVTASGSFALGSISTPTTGAQVLRIPRPKVKAAGGGFYYVELRQSFGLFDDFAVTDPVVTGLTIRLAPDYTINAVSQLLDATPGTASFYDAAFTTALPFKDPATGIEVNLTSLANGLAQVQVVVPTSGPRTK